MGYRKKGSTASLLSSGSIALLLVLAAGLMSNPTQALTGIRLACGGRAAHSCSSLHVLFLPAELGTLQLELDSNAGACVAVLRAPISELICCALMLCL